METVIRAAKYIELLAQRRLSALESAGDVRDVALAEGLAAGFGRTARSNALPDARELTERLEAEIRYIARKTGSTPDPLVLDRILGNVDDTLARLYGEGPDLKLTSKAISALEAVIRTDGTRPVLFVENDYVDLTAPSIGDYASALATRAEDVRRVCRAVGRIDDPQGNSLGYQGTCWVVAPNLVATNYHVLQEIAPGCSREGGIFTGTLKPDVSAHFGHEVGNPMHERRFPIKRVIKVGPEGAKEHYDFFNRLNLDDLDLAILELETVTGQRVPEPLPVARGDDPRTKGGLASKGRDVFVVGFPGNEKSTTPDVFSQLFHGVKSYKRLAPGIITEAAGEVPKDPKGWIITHDASTLGGNSGSAVADLAAPGGAVLGLHFGGRHKQRNWAHACERITQILDDVLPAPAWKAA